MEMVILGSTMLSPIFFIAARKYILSFLSFVGVGYMFFLIYKLGAPVRINSFEIKNFLYIADVLNVLSLASMVIYLVKKRKLNKYVETYESAENANLETKQLQNKEMNTFVTYNQNEDFADEKVREIMHKLKDS